MNVCLDTNILLRYFIDDKSTHHEQAKQLLNSVRDGKVRPYIPSVVILELNWVLLSFYKYPRLKVLGAIDTILSLRGLVIVDCMDTRKAYILHKRTHVKLADCLIVTQVPERAVLCTYDQEFQKIPGITVKTPEELIVQTVDK